MENDLEKEEVELRLVISFFFVFFCFFLAKVEGELRICSLDKKTLYYK